MSVLKSVESLYDFFEENKIDVNVEVAQLDFESIGYIELHKFNSIAMDKKIEDVEISKILKFLNRRNDNLASFITDILLSNKSFFRNDEVRERYHEKIEDRIYEDIDSFNLTGEKLKIIDYLFNDDIEKIYPLLEGLDYESKVDILMYIMEYSYYSEALDKTTPIGALLSFYHDIVHVMYDERDMFSYGEEIEFEGGFEGEE
jgi:hypothetical protein